MAIKTSIENVVNKVKDDPEFTKEFQSNPEKAVEKVLGVDIPGGAVDQVVAGVKAKVAGDKVGGAFDAIKKMF